MDESPPKTEEPAPKIPVVGIPEVVLLYQQRYNRLIIEDKGDEINIIASHNFDIIPQKNLVIKATYDSISRSLVNALTNGGWEVRPFGRGNVVEVGLRASRK